MDFVIVTVKLVNLCVEIVRNRAESVNQVKMHLQSESRDFEYDFETNQKYICSIKWQKLRF